MATEYNIVRSFVRPYSRCDPENAYENTCGETSVGQRRRFKLLPTTKKAEKSPSSAHKEGDLQRFQKGEGAEGRVNPPLRTSVPVNLPLL